MKYPPGTKLNFLTIQRYLPKLTNQQPVVCLCDCGKEKKFYLSNIIPKPNARYTKSCGCKRAGLVGEKTRKHGMTRTKFYKHWRSMFDRISDRYINADSYNGVYVSDEWKYFEMFKEDMYQSWTEHKKMHGARNTTLDRKDVYGPYSKENCRWATLKEQARNKKNTKYVLFKGKSLPLTEVCEILGKDYQLIYGRMKKGESLESSSRRRLWERRITEKKSSK